MPSLLDLWGTRPLSELAARVGIPFRRLGEYATGARRYSPADHATLAAFFGIAPEQLTQDTPSTPAPTPGSRRRATPSAPPALAPAIRPPRPPDAPAPTAIVTTQGQAQVRVSGLLQRPPAPAPGAQQAGGRARFWQLELLVPHQPLRGSATNAPLLVRCNLHQRQLDPYRWLAQGDRVVLTGTPIPRADHLYLPDGLLSTPRAARLLPLLEAQRSGDPAAQEALQKLLGPDWSAALNPPPGVGVQEQRPPWSPPPEPVDGPQGRVQLTLQAQLQADPTIELDEQGGGLAELRLEIAPPEQAGRLPVVRYRVQLRPRALRGLTWLQRGDTVRVEGDIVAVGDELLVEAASLKGV